MSTNPTAPPNALTRAEVYDRINGELIYAYAKVAAMGCPSSGRHNPAEFLIYMEHYIAHAKTLLSTISDAQAIPAAMEDIRKIAGLAVTAMEQHGVEPRKTSKTHWCQSELGGGTCESH